MVYQSIQRLYDVAYGFNSCVNWAIYACRDKYLCTMHYTEACEVFSFWRLPQVDVLKWWRIPLLAKLLFAIEQPKFWRVDVYWMQTFHVNKNYDQVFDTVFIRLLISSRHFKVLCFIVTKSKMSVAIWLMLNMPKSYTSPIISTRVVLLIPFKKQKWSRFIITELLTLWCAYILP